MEIIIIHLELTKKIIFNQLEIKVVLQYNAGNGNTWMEPFRKKTGVKRILTRLRTF